MRGDGGTEVKRGCVGGRTEVNGSKISGGVLIEESCRAAELRPPEGFNKCHSG